MKSSSRIVLISISVIMLLCCFGNPVSALVKSNKIKINKTTIRYLDVGRGHPIVFIHGSLGDYRTWENQIEPFAKQYRVISYSRRYHYPNPWAGNGSDDSMMTHVNDLIALLKTLKLERVHLVGHSYGACIALMAALKYPEFIRSLTLAEPPLLSLVQNSQLADSLIMYFIRTSFMPAGQALQKKQMKTGVKLFLSGVFGDPRAYENLLPSVQKIMMQNALELKIATTSAIKPLSLTCGDVQKIQIPTLLVAGERSPRWFRLIIDKLKECLPINELLILPKSSHGLEFQNPEEFNAKVLEFLNKH